MHTKYFIIIFVLACFNCFKSLGQQKEVFEKSYIKANLLKVANWQMQHSNKKPLNDWTNGALYTGIFAAYQITKSKLLLDSMMAMGNRYQWRPGRRFDHADDYAITQTYIDFYRINKDKSILQPSLDSLEKMKTQPGNEIKKHGIIWWWCDALFMAPPVLAKLAKTLNDPSWLVLSDSLFRQTYKLLYNKEDHLFARDASYLIDVNGNGKLESNGKKIYWARGNGWVMGGLVRFLHEMPKGYEGRAFYINLYKEMANSLLALQQADGLWRTSLLDPNAYPGGEGSGTGFNCYALAWGLNNKILDKGTFLNAVQKAWVGLNGLVLEEGAVGWVQPIGADPKSNFSINSWEAYGAGAYLLAGSEIIKLKN